MFKNDDQKGMVLHKVQPNVCDRPMYEEHIDDCLEEH